MCVLYCNLCYNAITYRLHFCNNIQCFACFCVLFTAIFTVCGLIVCVVLCCLGFNCAFLAIFQINVSNNVILKLVRLSSRWQQRLKFIKIQLLDHDCIRTALQTTEEAMSKFSTMNRAELHWLTRSWHNGSLINSLTKGAASTSIEQSAPVKPDI